MVIYYKQKKYEEVIKYGLKALKIKKRNKHLTEEISCWDGTIYDYLSLSYFYLKDYDNAIKYIDLDIKENPDIERLKERNNKLLCSLENNNIANKVTEELKLAIEKDYVNKFWTVC